MARWQSGSDHELNPSVITSSRYCRYFSGAGTYHVALKLPLYLPGLLVLS